MPPDVKRVWLRDVIHRNLGEQPLVVVREDGSKETVVTTADNLPALGEELGEKLELPENSTLKLYGDSMLAPKDPQP